MIIASHLEKFRRFNALRSRFDPDSEFELWYWMSLSAGTAVINAALHTAGVTREHRSFATQFAHVYLVMDQDDSSHHAILHDVDIIHVGMPAVKSPLPPEIAEAYDAMETIEKFRDPCVRGDHPINGEVVEACSAAYRKCIAAALKAADPLRTISS